MKKTCNWPLHCTHFIYVLGIFRKPLCIKQFFFRGKFVQCVNCNSEFVFLIPPVTPTIAPLVTFNRKPQYMNLQKVSLQMIDLVYLRCFCWCVVVVVRLLMYYAWEERLETPIRVYTVSYRVCAPSNRSYSQRKLKVPKIYEMLDGCRQLFVTWFVKTDRFAHLLQIIYVFFNYDLFGENIVMSA